MEIKKAVRRALPMQFAFAGPTGSGKTLSALLFAAGLAPDGKVAVADTERGRASVYSDNKRVLAVLPRGFDVIEIDPPYSPLRYIEAIDLAESKGYKVFIIDSGSDSWDGPGGCCDIAEKANGMWNGAKLQNKKMMMRAAYSDMHIIWCLKAHSKVRIIDKKKSESGKQEYEDLGIQPIWEKNNFYPMLLAFMVDAETHEAKAIKCIDDLWPLFPEPKLITRADGMAIRKWNESGAAIGEYEQLSKRARAAAEQGMTEYSAFFAAITKEQRVYLTDTSHAENKQIAQGADEGSVEARLTELASHDRFLSVLGALGYENLNEVQPADRKRVLGEIEAELADAWTPPPAEPKSQAAPAADPPRKPVDPADGLDPSGYATAPAEPKRRRFGA